MIEIPPDAVPVRTVRFDDTTIPSGLLRTHRLHRDAWATLVVEAGLAEFVFEDVEAGFFALAVGDRVVIPPGRPHHVRLRSETTIALTFHHRPAPPDDRGAS